MLIYSLSWFRKLSRLVLLTKMGDCPIWKVFVYHRLEKDGFYKYFYKEISSNQASLGWKKLKTGWILIFVPMVLSKFKILGHFFCWLSSAALNGLSSCQNFFLDTIQTLYYSELTKYEYLSLEEMVHSW